ncbi:MAG: hypothetical protein WEC15_03780 [Flavobacteriales bacterium]
MCVVLPFFAFTQGTEDFTDLPATPTPGNYIARTWLGTDGVTWTAVGARTDQTMTGKAICFGTGGNRWVTSPIYTNGMGNLSFEYVRGFTGGGARTIQVWVNGMQIGANISVNATSDVVQTFSQAINVGGNVQLEIRSIGASQVMVDNIVWTPYTAGPTASFSAATQSTPEGSGLIPVTFNITPATLTGGTITLIVANGPGVVYGAGGDYTTAPAGGIGTITVPVPTGATTASFNVNLINDLFWEPSKTITFAVTAVTGDLEVGFPNTHVFTILNDDFTPTAYFSPTSANFLESAGPINIPISVTPAATAGTLTLSITNGPGAVYGADYTTAPDGSGGSITLNVPAGATVVILPVTLLDDLDIESTETVTFTLTGATGGLLFGPSPTFFLSISDNDTPPTLLEPGDLVIVGVNANNLPSCGGASAEDIVSFFCFKPIVFGTEIILSDNGYERVNLGLWGNTEGTVRMVRTGGTIPAGQVVTFRFANTGNANVSSIAPDAGWSCTGLSVGPVNLNNGGDQLFFMQGGIWNNGTFNVHNASYSGRILFGFTTNSAFPWSAAPSTQRSNLPPGIECFSMAPTLATDYNKYTGPQTNATQRDWIIRVDDVANWTTYTDCAEYNSSGTNWLTAPTMPFTPGAYVAGRWRGAVSTDWFDCKNWDDVVIPTATTAVTIDPVFATLSCEVGLAIGSTAECASVLLTTAGVNRQLLVRNSSTLNINGPLVMDRTTAGPLTTIVFDNSALNAGSITLQGVTAGSNEATLRCEQGGTIRVEDDLVLGIGGLLDLQGIAGVVNTLELGGDLLNLETELKFQDLNSTVRCIGASDQTISVASGPEVFHDLIVDKTGGNLVLASPVDVRNTLELSGGRVLNTATELLTLRAGAVATNASDASFVLGPMQKIGNTPFIFPVGNGSFLRPCSLSAISGAAGVAFTAEYFAASPRTTFNNVLEPTLDHISDCEYWTIDRSIGTPNATVTLSWREPMSCGVTDLPSLRVARWDGSMWLDRGNNVATGTTLAGFIPTAAVQTAFSPWTLASINNTNPLPITLLSFTATAVQRSVLLDWTTATETNNDFFTVERSADGNSFLPLFRVEGAGEGTSFSALHYRTVDDAPLSGQSYYRLRQTDLDGTSTVSDVVSVWMGEVGHRPLAVHADAELLTAFHGFQPGARYTLLDMTGRLITTGTTQQEGLLQLPMGQLPAGAYLLRMDNGMRVESARFVR